MTERTVADLAVQLSFVKHNRVYYGAQSFNVPYINKELTIAYETYRDKTCRAVRKKWKLKISGSKNDKVAAEMLTAMYDASLDQFKPQGWSIPQPARLLFSWQRLAGAG